MWLYQLHNYDTHKIDGEKFMRYSEALKLNSQLLADGEHSLWILAPATRE